MYVCMYVCIYVSIDDRNPWSSHCRLECSLLAYVTPSALVCEGLLFE